MDRVRINIPDKIHFTTNIEVRVSDLNYGDHLGNERFLSFAQEARVRFFLELGLNEFDIGGTGIIQSDAAIVYRSEGNLGDVIRVDLTITEFGSSAFSIVYNMINLTTGKELAVVKTGIVCYDYDLQKIRPVPESFKAIFENS